MSLVLQCRVFVGVARDVIETVVVVSPMIIGVKVAEEIEIVLPHPFPAKNGGDALCIH